MVAIVTDSTSDLDAVAAAAAGITVVPLFVNFGDARFRDNVELTRDAFYERLRTQDILPTTAQPMPADFAAAFRPHVEAGEPVVCITIMASLSGTINAATAASREFPGAEIHVVDSGSVAGGLALQAQHASELARAGADAPVILAALERDRANGRGFAAIPDLSHAVRTGRVSRTQAFLGSALKIVSVLRIDDGRIAEHARVRTFARALESMVDAAAAEADRGDGARICVIHSHAGETAARVTERLRARLVRAPARFETLEAGPVIGTHAGEGAVGIFVIAGA